MDSAGGGSQNATGVAAEHAEEATSWNASGTSVRVETHDDIEIMMMASDAYHSSVYADIEVRPLFLDGGYETESWGSGGGAGTSTQWSIRTRRCHPRSHTVQVSCSGECGCSSYADDGSPPCPTGGYVKDKDSKACTGPYVGWSNHSSNCLSDDEPARSITYYNCNASCTRKWCD
jgi:hypothetical protein